MMIINNLALKALGCITILTGILTLESCRKDRVVPKWDADELIPLANTSINLYHLSEYDEITSDSSGALILSYKDELLKLDLDSLINLPDTSLTERIENIIFVGFPPGVSIDLMQNEETQLAIADAELVEATISSGSINVTITSTFSEPSTITYELSSATKNGNPLVIAESINAGSISSPITIIKSYSLSDYKIDFRGVNGTSYNTLIAQISAMVDENADTLISQFGDFIDIKYAFTDLKPSYAKGYFGNRLYSNIGSESFSFLVNYTNGNIDMESLSMKIDVTNNVGVDLQFQMNEIKTHNTNLNTASILSNDDLHNSININRAIETGNPTIPVFPSNYEIQLNESNSNIDELFEVMPNQISYDFDVLINPLGHVSSHNDFIYADESIDVMLELEIPVSIALDQFTLCDTLDFNLGEKTIEDRHLIANGFIHLYADNWYPFAATCQLYLLDENYAVLDSILLEDQIIDAGNPDENNVVTSPTSSKISGIISPDKIDHLYAARFLKMNFNLSTASYPQFVKIYDDYKIDATLVGDFNYVIDFND